MLVSHTMGFDAVTSPKYNAIFMLAYGAGLRVGWASRFDELDKVLEELKRKEMTDGRKKRE